MRAVIFAGGEIPDREAARRALRTDDWIVAADGGSAHCLALGLTPSVLIGDLDSVDAAQTAAWRQAGVEVIPHPTDKDKTDLELALLLAVDRGADEIVILGGLGGRWDQTVANLLLPAAERFMQASVRLLDGDDEIQWLRGGDARSLDGAPGDVVSLIALSAQAEGITTSGLTYPLQGEDLPLGATQGVSNVLAGRICRISLRHGLLLCVHHRRVEREAGPPAAGRKAKRGTGARRRKPERRQ